MGKPSILCSFIEYLIILDQRFGAVRGAIMGSTTLGFRQQLGHCLERHHLEKSGSNWGAGTRNPAMLKRKEERLNLMDRETRWDFSHFFLGRRIGSLTSDKKQHFADTVTPKGPCHYHQLCQGVLISQAVRWRRSKSQHLKNHLPFEGDQMHTLFWRVWNALITCMWHVCHTPNIKSASKETLVIWTCIFSDPCQKFLWDADFTSPLW